MCRAVWENFGPKPRKIMLLCKFAKNRQQILAGEVSFWGIRVSFSYYFPGQFSDKIYMVK